MKLISLTCDQPNFKPLIFNETGLSIILGDGAKTVGGTTNGVGKTLSLKLVHHCLGANGDSLLAQKVPDWIFTLHFKIKNDLYKVSRTGDGKTIWLLDKVISLKEYKKWLNEQDIFKLQNNIPNLTFRALVKRFTRISKADCENATSTAEEKDYVALLRTIFLLGIDHQLVLNKHLSKIELDKSNKLINQYKDDPILLDFFRAGTQPKVRLEFLEKEIPRLKDDIDKFKVADDYRDIELEANRLTASIRDLAFKQEALIQNINNINQVILDQPDITKNDLLELYKGIELLFKAEALQHFDAVERFHNNLSVNRRQRLEEEKLQLNQELEEVNSQRQVTENLRDEKVQYLHGKRALDDYVVLTQKLAQLTSEHERLIEYNEAISNLEKQKLEIKAKRLEDDIKATAYVDSNPIQKFDDEFTKIANLLYPRVAAGITLSANNGDRNQIRYDITASIEGDGSDGISDAVILCFDWVVLTLGLNHSMKMLWHDNRLFADIDPKVRATWLNYISVEAQKRGYQYIISINTENFDAMKDYLSDDDFKAMESKKIVRLKGDNPYNKLLGIQFG